MICPKCGMEFKEGVLQCTDCGIDLVESMESYEEDKVYLASFPSEYAERINDFLIYSKIVTELAPSDKEGYTDLYVAEPQMKEAAKLASVFISQEPVPRPEGELTEEEEAQEQFYSPSGRQYKRAQVRYDEAVSTGYTFIGFGIVLLLVIGDHFITKLLPEGSLLMYIVFAGMAVGLLYGAFKYLTSLPTLKEAIGVEEKDEATVIAWLEQSFRTIVDLDDKVIEVFGETSMEEMELNRSSYLNAALTETFPEMKKEFLEFESELYLNRLMEEDEA